MDVREWLARNEANLESPLERLFVEQEVLARVSGLNLAVVQPQLEFRDL